MTDGSRNSLAVLAGLIAAPPDELLAPRARAIAGMALTDLVGVTLAGLTEEVSRIAIAFAVQSASRPGAPVFGPGTTVPSCEAAFANSVIGHALDFDDSSFILGGHPSVVIFPALLSVAEPRGIPPVEVVSAYLVGLEALSRLAAAVNFRLYELGWHPTATLGVIGAAAAVAHLLRLGQERTEHALGLAAATACGFKASFGTMAKPIQVGHACRSGVAAALLAEAGATASAGALDAPNGFFTLFNGAGNFHPEALARPSGDGLPALRFKLYPSCGATHVVIDAARALRARHGFRASEIDRVEVRINPRRLPHVDRAEVTDPLGGKFSVQYTAAAALADGYVGIEHFTRETLGRDDIRALAARIEAGPLGEPVEGLAQPCGMRLTTRAGTVHEIRLDGPSGREPSCYPANMEDKFMACAGRVLPTAAARALFERARRFETLATVGELTAGLVSDAGRAGAAQTRDRAHV